MATRKLPYREGDVIAVPLRDGGYAVGVAARLNGKGAVVGYFFGQRYGDVPDLDEIGELNREEAVLIQTLGDLGLIRGTWPVIGQLPGWRREEWPMPVFGRREELTGRCFRVEYPDGDPNGRPREVPISSEECDHLPEDGAAGFGFIEARLTRLLSTAAR